MKIYLLIFALSIPLLADDAVKKGAENRVEQFYCVHSGEHYQHLLWKKVSPMEFRKMDQSTIYEHFKIEHKDKSTEIHRSYSTPSGDWFFELNYIYNQKGNLTKVTSTFITHGGIDLNNPEADVKPTTHIQQFEVSPKKKLTQSKSLIQDSNTEKKVNRTFYQPKMKH